MPEESSLADDLLANQPELDDDGNVVDDPPAEETVVEEPVVDEAPPVEPDVEPPATDDEPPQPVSERDIFAIAEAAGAGWLREKYENEDAALHGLVHAVKKLSERDDDAAYGRQFRQYQNQFQDFLQQQQVPQPDPPPAAKDEPPQIDQRILPYLEATSEGLLYAKEGAPPVVTPERIAEAQRWVDYQQQKRREFETFDPDAIRREAEAKAVEAIESRFAEERLRREAEEIVAERALEPWFFARDGMGNVVRDPQTGGDVLSETGYAYQKYLREAHDVLGIHDPRSMDKYARAMALSTIPPSPSKTPATPSQPPRPPAPPATPPGGTHRRTPRPGGTPAPDTVQQPTNLYDALLASNKAAAASGEKVYEIT